VKDVINEALVADAALLNAKVAEALILQEELLPNPEMEANVPPTQTLPRRSPYLGGFLDFMDVSNQR